MPDKSDQPRRADQEQTEKDQSNDPWTAFPSRTRIRRSKRFGMPSAKPNHFDDDDDGDDDDE